MPEEESSVEEAIETTKRILDKHRIPYKSWGKDKAKTLEDLADEVENGESNLVEEDGKLLRLINVAAINIFYEDSKGKYILREGEQIFKDGRKRTRKNIASITEKMLPGESIEKASERGINEELGQDTGGLELKNRRENSETKQSQSYPGLLSRYSYHLSDIQFSQNQYNPDGYTEDDGKKTTKFYWEEIKQ